MPDLRTGLLPGYSAASATPLPSFSSAPEPTTAIPLSEFEKGVQRGAANMESGLYGAQQAYANYTGNQELEQQASDNAAMADAKANDLSVQANVGSVFDINGLSDTVDWALGGIGSVVPYAAATMAGGVLGGMFGRAGAGLVGAGRGAGVKLGAAAGGFATVAPIETGSLYREIDKESGIQAPVESLVGGSLIAGLDLLAPASLLHKMAPSGNLLGRVGKRAALTGAIEGVTEGAQEAVGIGTRDYVDPNYDALAPENFEANKRQVLEAAALGAVAGGALGAPAGLVAPTKHSETSEVNKFVAPESEGLAPSLAPSDKEPFFDAVSSQIDRYQAGEINENQLSNFILETEQTNPVTDPELRKINMAELGKQLARVTQPVDTSLTMKGIISPEVIEGASDLDGALENEIGIGRDVIRDYEADEANVRPDSDAPLERINILDVAKDSLTSASAKGHPFASLNSARKEAVRLGRERPDIKPEIVSAYSAIRSDLKDQGFTGKELAERIVAAGKAVNRPFARRSEDPVEYLRSSYVLRSAERESEATKNSGLFEESDLQGRQLSAFDKRQRGIRTKRIEKLTSEIEANTKAKLPASAVEFQTQKLASLKRDVYNTAKLAQQKQIVQDPITSDGAPVSPNAAQIEVKDPKGKTKYLSLPSMTKLTLDKMSKELEKGKRIENTQKAFTEALARMDELGYKIDPNIPDNKVILHGADGVHLTFADVFKSTDRARLIKKVDTLAGRLDSLQLTAGSGTVAQRARVAESIASVSEKLTKAKEQLKNTPATPGLAEVMSESHKALVKKDTAAQARREDFASTIRDEVEEVKTELVEVENTIPRDTDGRMPSNQSEQIARKHRGAGDVNIVPKSAKEKSLGKILDQVRALPARDAVALFKSTNVLRNPGAISKTEAVATIQHQIMMEQKIQRDLAAIEVDKKSVPIKVTTQQQADTLQRRQADVAITREKIKNLAPSQGVEQVKALGLKTMDEVVALDTPQKLAKLQTAFDSLTKNMGMNTKVYAMSVAEAIKEAELAGVNDYAAKIESGVLHGFTSTLKNGTIKVFIHPGLTGKLRNEIIAHEFGHVVYRTLGAQLNNEAFVAIRKDFNSWVAKHGNGDAAALLRSKKTPRAAVLAAINGLDGVNVAELPADARAYLLEFEEWFADRMSVFVNDATTKVDGPVAKFFHDAVVMMKKLLGRLGVPGFGVYGLGANLVTDAKSFSASFDTKAEAEYAAANANLTRGFSDYATHGISSLMPEVSIPGGVAARIRKAVGDVKDSELASRGFQLWQQGLIKVGPKLYAVFDSVQAKLDKTLANLEAKRDVPLATSESVVPSALAAKIKAIGGRYNAKDAEKAAKATAFIGAGVPGSSTAKYRSFAYRLGMLKKEYSQKDIVFVSTNGKRANAVEPVVNGKLTEAYADIDKALKSGATIVVDNTANRQRSFNTGERALYDYLEKKGYQYTDNPKGGFWRDPAAYKPTLATSEAIGPRSEAEMRLNNELIPHVLQRNATLTSKIFKGLEKFFYTADTRLRKTKIPELMKLANMLHVRVGEQGIGQTMWEQKQQSRGQFDATVRRIFHGLSFDEGRNVIKILHSSKSMSKYSAKEQAAAHKTFELMGMIHDYMNKAGMKIGKRGDDYFPWIFDIQKVHAKTNGEAFIKFILKDKFKAGVALELERINAIKKERYDAEVEAQKLMGKLVFDEFKPMGPNRFAREMWENIATNDGVMESMNDVSNTPSMRSTNRRQLDFVRQFGDQADTEYLADMMSDDLGLQLSNYISQAVKRAEYVRRFGIDDSKLEAMLTKARDEGATDEDIILASQYVNSTMGVHGRGTALWLSKTFGIAPPPGGKPINPHVQKTLGSIMVYQNIRLLALATFTSLADPMGIAARSGNLNLAFYGFKEAVKTIFANNKGDIKDLAEMLGIIDYATVNEALGWEYGGVYLSGTARKLNENFFKYTGLTGWTRITRVMATAAATKFISTHASKPNKHSARYLKELNLKASDVTVKPDGMLHVLSYTERKKASAVDLARDDRVREAVVRFVDESILRPNPSQRPIWASDPHYMLGFHLKSFMYSYHDRILRRVWHEMKQGNFGHLLGLMAYIPVMIAADLVRELIQFAGGEDPRKANWGMMDYVGDGIIRAGLPGVPGLTAFDVYRDVKFGGIPGVSLLGPTVEQITDLEVGIKAMPLQPVYNHWLDK